VVIGKWRSLPFFVLEAEEGRFDMLWYVLQTRTGEEEKLVDLIHQMVSNDLYEECFVVYQELLWRRQQQNFVHVRRAFPGYVFITSREPKSLFFCLKQVPVMSRMIADEDFFFLSLESEEAEFLRRIMNEDYVIRLSYMETDGKGNIRQVSGPLEACVSQIVQCRFKKRYVLVRFKLHQEEKTVLLGIVLHEDICEELKYEKVEAPFLASGQYKPGKALDVQPSGVPILVPKGQRPINKGSEIQNAIQGKEEKCLDAISERKEKRLCYGV
jgi:transcription antitermination factor NusG